VAIHPDGNHIVFSQDEELFIVYLEDAFPETFGNSSQKNIDETKQKIISNDEDHSHDYFITDVSFSPDGSLIISADRSGYIKVWSFTDRKLLSTIQDHSDEVTSIAFSPKGQFLATASYDEEIHIWKVEELTNLKPEPYRIFYKKSKKKTPPTYQHEMERIISITFSHDGKHIASGDQQGLIVIREVETEREITRKKIHGMHIRSLCFSPADKGLLATASDDSRIRLYDFINGDRPETLGILLDKHKKALNSIAFSPLGDILVSSAKDGIIKLWNISERRLIRNISPDNDCRYVVDKVAFFPNKYDFATDCFASDISLWHISNQGGITNTKINFDLRGIGKSLFSVFDKSEEP
jgi:WD40 repeat protein